MLPVRFFPYASSSIFFRMLPFRFFPYA
jgi:hypothetical protein